MMENKSCLWEFARYTLLSVLGMLGVSCYILADTFFISRGMGARGLTALNLAIPVYSFIHGTGLMLGMGGGTRFSICRIRRDREHANSEYSHTVLLAVIFSLVFILLGVFCSGTLTTLLQADEEVFEMTNTYVRWLLFFSPAFLMNEIFLCFLRNDEEPRLPMLGMLVGSLANIILDYIFIFPLGLGIFGAVFATGVSPVISILVMLPHWLKQKNGFHLVRGRRDLQTVVRILSIGFPSLISQVAFGVVMILFNFLILDLEGNVGVAAYGVIANISLVVTAVYTGISQGMQPLISEFYGIGAQRECRRVFRYGVISVAIISAVIYMILFLWADPITAVFNKEADVHLQRMATEGMKLYFISNLFVGYNVVFTVYLSSVEHIVLAHVLTLLRGLILIIPTAVFLAVFLGMTGIWLAYPAAEGITALFGCVMDYAGLRAGKASLE